MSRLFRRPDASLSGYAALMLFAAAYLGVLALVLAPGQFVGTAVPQVEAPGNP